MGQIIQKSIVASSSIYTHIRCHHPYKPCVVSKEDQEMAMRVRMASVGVLPRPGKAGKRKAVVCSVAGLSEQYRTLRVEPGASEKEVKRAFRQLALQYHPDVCRGSNCGVQFHRINEAYDMVMKQLRECGEDDGCRRNGYENVVEYEDDEMRGMYDSSWELWEEWMGWEGAGIRDYSSHINPYI